MKVKIILLTILVIGGANSAAAHHSFAMFDQEKTLTIEGTVREMEWTNPHAWLHVTAPNAAGKAATWSFEMNSINALSRQGWTKETMKAGERVSIRMHPLKDGSRGGQFVTATVNGKLYGDGLIPLPGARGGQ